jgi:hypothetical protein
MREIERLESEHTPERDRVIASEHRLSHVSIGELLRGGHSGALRVCRPQPLHPVVSAPSDH